DRDPRAGHDIGQHARNDYLDVEILLTSAQRADDVEQQAIDRAHAGGGVENEGKHREQEDDNRLSADPDAEEDDHQRRQRHQRAGVKHGHERIERVADPHASAHQEADRNPDENSGGETIEERHRADAQVAQQIAAVDQIHQARGDEVRFADEQRIERNEQ